MKSVLDDRGSRIKTPRSLVFINVELFNAIVINANDFPTRRDDEMSIPTVPFHLCCVFSLKNSVIVKSLCKSVQYDLIFINVKVIRELTDLLIGRQTVRILRRLPFVGVV